MILSLDPSSTCIGYAWMDSEMAVANAGFLTPEKKTAHAVKRIDSLLLELRAMLAEQFTSRQRSVRTILVELPTGKQYTRGKERQSALPVWAVAAGAVYGFLTSIRYCKLVAVSNTQWTAKQPKRTRQVLCKCLYPHYDPTQDPGGDVSDAIMMARWWMAKENTDAVS